MLMDTRPFAVLYTLFHAFVHTCMHTNLACSAWVFGHSPPYRGDTVVASGASVQGRETDIVAMCANIGCALAFRLCA